MIDYSKSIIYKLCCKDINIKEIYIGSTTNFKRRKCEHKFICNNSNNKKYNLNVYKFIRANGNWDNWDMVIIEKFECNDNLELHRRERYWLENLQATLNMCIPNRSKKEWEDDNKENYNKKRREKVECNICNKVINRGNLNRHKKIHN